jgi:hypothetical protein
VTAPLTLTAYAKRRGVSVKSVSIAVRDRRLVDSVGRDARDQPTILDPELADREWEANTRRRAERPAVVESIAGRIEPAQGRPCGAEGATPSPATTRNGAAAPAITLSGCPPEIRHTHEERVGAQPAVPDFNVSRDLRAAADARKAVAAAGIAEIELEAKRGSVVPVAEVRAEVIERYSLVKTRLLAVPSAVGQRMPDIAVRVVAVVDELVREALEELAAEVAPDGRSE